MATLLPPFRDPVPWRRLDVRLLTVDCGNSTLDCMVHDDEPAHRSQLGHTDRGALAALLERAPCAIAATSNVAGGLDTLAALAAERRIPFAVAGHQLPCPLESDYTTPATLGSDRWVAAFAAHHGFGEACVVVDCGTAVTIDLVDANGRFRGGMIAPGAATMAFGLAQRAPVLPAADLGAVPLAVPRSSKDAVSSGVLHAFCGVVERAVRALADAADDPQLRVVLTGGEAAIYAKHGTLPVTPVPDLVHRGLVELWSRLQPQSNG
ncbi:MAG: type III pantothenate kinase [Planctomycetes bacterium]|nr:type III pantothenate kinase [Planctomycetota bacterium]MCB9888196.1 type III pantothenate kinase [Planctomycetota bacterium]